MSMSLDSVKEALFHKNRPVTKDYVIRINFTADQYSAETLQVLMQTQVALIAGGGTVALLEID